MKYLIFITFCLTLSDLWANNDKTSLTSERFYCTGSQCPERPVGVYNNEYPNAICVKEYRCEGYYLEKKVANRCGCCACNGGSIGCAGNQVLCRDGTFSQMCRCRYRLID